MRAYLIDTPNKQITEVDYNGDFHTIHELLGIECFTTVMFNTAGDMVFVDDEGLINGNPDGWFVYLGYGQPLRGKGLVLGTDYNTGESVEPRMGIETLRNMISFPEDHEVGEIDTTIRVTSLEDW